LLTSRVAAGKQRHIVTARDEFFGEPVDNPFRATVEPGWNGLRQWRDLRDAHVNFPFTTASYE
jgi:hypothetical protein